jgi:hypothetical protein
MDSIYPLSTSQSAHKRRDLTPNQQAALTRSVKLSLLTARSRQKPSKSSRLR